MTDVRMCARCGAKPREGSGKGTNSYCRECKARLAREIRHRDKGPEIIEMRQCAGPGCMEVFRWSSWDGRDAHYHDSACKREAEKQGKRQQRERDRRRLEGRAEWRCPRCRTSKPRGEFSVNAHIGNPCKDCQRAANRALYEKNPERFRTGKRNSSRNRRMAKYLYLDGGVLRPMTEDDFDQEFIEQGAACKIAACRSPFVQRAPDVDHDHVTMRFRGLLCRSCNLRLHANVTVEWYLAAADYLRETAAS